MAGCQRGIRLSTLATYDKNNNNCMEAFNKCAVKGIAQRSYGADGESKTSCEDGDQLTLFTTD